jgi:prepilin-type N-terminal cleavage/methylation domain-containing protein
MIKNNKKGFSLLEVMLALGVITIGLTGVSSLVLQNIQVQEVNKNYLVASMLAQEGLELVRNVRDTNFLKADSGYSWKNGIGPLGNTKDIVHGGSYAIDYDLSIQNAASMDVDQTKLYINTGKYTHSGGNATPYRRLIKVIDNSDYVEVQANVQWSERGRKHNYLAVANLYNWW